MHPHLVEQLKHRRAFVQAVRLRRPALRRHGPLPRVQDPNHIRLGYYAAIRRLVLLPARRLVHERLLPELPSIVSSSGVSRARGRADADPGDVNELVGGISVDFFDGVSQSSMEDIAEQYAAATSSFQKEQLARQLRTAVGVDVPIGDPHLRPLVETFTATNVALIKSIPTRYFEQLQSKLMVDVSAGKRWEEIADDLEDRYEVSEATAKLVARDQVGKFYGSLNEVRQRDLGIEEFIWRTANDNRVRDSHKELEGQSFRWDELPTNDDGEEIEPGSEVNCRCNADPNVQSVVDDLDEQDEAA